MIKKLLMAGVVAAALGSNAPAASASHHSAGCHFNAVSQSTLTGQDTWEGVVVGYIIGHPGERVGIRCVFKVGTSVRAATDWSPDASLGVAVTVSRVTFTKSPTEVVQLCAQYYTDRHGFGEQCFAATTTQIPPKEVIDALDTVERDVVEPMLCAVLEGWNGSYGPVEIKPGTGGTGGDVYVNGELFWDCPEYEPIP